VRLLAADKSNFPSATVRLQMLDNDSAYRNLGRAEFLA
jgi:hypothetical protein